MCTQTMKKLARSLLVGAMVSFTCETVKTPNSKLHCIFIADGFRVAGPALGPAFLFRKHGHDARHVYHLAAHVCFPPVLANSFHCNAH